jgi:hypothetical protein
MSDHGNSEDVRLSVLSGARPARGSDCISLARFGSLLSMTSTGTCRRSTLFSLTWSARVPT